MSEFSVRAARAHIAKREMQIECKARRALKCKMAEARAREVVRSRVSRHAPLSVRSTPAANNTIYLYVTETLDLLILFIRDDFYC